MSPCHITFEVRGIPPPGEVLAICGSCNSLGSWDPQSAVILQPEEEAGDVLLWRTTVPLPRGDDIEYRYFQGTFLEPQKTGGPCQVIIHKWETHLPPRSITPLEDISVDDGHFGIVDDVESVDSGWLTCQTEIRLRLHFSEKPPVSITKRKFKKSRFRVKLTLEGLEEEGEDEEDDRLSPTIQHKMPNTLEISLISDTEFKSRHSQPECGYGLQPDRWTEYTIQTMEPDNLELIFDFFEEDLSEAVIQGDALPGHVGSACLLSSTLAESGKSCGILTLPIMSRLSRKTIGKVRVDYIIIKPIQGYSCDVKASYAKYWRDRTGLDVGHRGAGNSTTTTKLAKLRENTIASLKNAAKHGAAFVEFDVHLSKDHVPIIYHDLTCCIAMKKKDESEPVELFEIPVKELTYAQLQLLKLLHVTALKSKDSEESFKEDKNAPSDTQPFPSLQSVLETIPEEVGFNIEIKWICQQRDGLWDGNLSTYFDMNLYLDILLKTVLLKAGRRRVIFSSFDADICTMVRHKQNKYPILFLTQGKCDTYPELMDLRSRTTAIATSFAQFENLLGINAHTEELLLSPSFVAEARSKGLVVFCWGDKTNELENRKKLREYGVHGLVYDRIYDWMPEQPNIFQTEQLERLKQEVPELKSCLCPTVSHFSSLGLCKCSNSTIQARMSESSSSF
ncbi:glycerophosphocholine phosphodiesterase GPCPD1 isoform X1 [Podarcis raffonei]|uniref:glycerophosphocholine phosphodiesterase GPCPD1 isoform X1 n=1 Tax=Podarcis raffonei TaxID=65483 RepID=UPI0023290E94|nr:glycerophosphocholine phosphodiesterase GPCPD1 isoform X1 [Podarcis raffonei]XP_053236689.1 glycerophosphocholine phosphodiesterase GPCPD1 isoform X1 [Podarcis raffonei]XP_053236690.1 glycerophosphocholine phosphodiesterase GPCPD1 isoform X1 [Podarcis raffonei]XP_053236691.1 glycerophosphocholine phosphodiesterase GPCPD1 isoform X1 [Podarcis raffonei]